MQPTAPFGQKIRPGDRPGFKRVLALDQYGRTDAADHVKQLWFRFEDHYTVNAPQFSKHQAADGFRNNRTQRSLQSFDRRIRIHRDDQRIALSTGFPEEGEVARMESVKTSICEHDSHNSSQ